MAAGRNQRSAAKRTKRDGEPTVPAMTIGQLARAAEVGVDTVRFYERRGLLPRAQRRASGYRLFGADDVRRLRFVRRAKDLGFSLEEIAELLSLEHKRGEATGRAKALAVRKLRVVEQKLAELAALRVALRTLIEACPGQGAPEQCPILQTFSEP